MNTTLPIMVAVLAAVLGLVSEIRRKADVRRIADRFAAEHTLHCSALENLGSILNGVCRGRWTLDVNGNAFHLGDIVTYRDTTGRECTGSIMLNQTLNRTREVYEADIDEPLALFADDTSIIPLNRALEMYPDLAVESRGAMFDVTPDEDVADIMRLACSVSRPLARTAKCLRNGDTMKAAFLCAELNRDDSHPETFSLLKLVCASVIETRFFGGKTVTFEMLHDIVKASRNS